MMRVRLVLVLVLSAALPLLEAAELPWFPPLTKPKPKLKVSPEAQAFLEVFTDANATREQRQEAWKPLVAEGKRPSKAVAKAVDKARKRAWAKLDALIRSPEVRKTGAGLLKAIQPHQAKARDTVNGAGFGKEKLDEAMAPITQALDEAMKPYRESEHYTATRSEIDDLEAYAVDCGLRHAWSEEIAEQLATLRFVARCAGKTTWLETVDSNHGIGAWIDPGEYACIARLNWHRMLIGLHPVHIDLRLVVAARKHSEEMAAKGYFSHTSPTPSLASPWTRASREHTRAGGECIAGAGSGGGPPGAGGGAFRMWYYSQGHHKIMISGAAAIGVGRKGDKWTLMMGGSKMAGTTATKMAQYVRKRYEAGDDTAKLFALARWCTDNRLLTQAQDELERILLLDPAHEQAQKVLDRMRGASAPIPKKK